MHDVIVIGSGIFGSIIARVLRRSGRTVLVVDDRRPDRGSAPAGCVIKPSWVSSMRKPDLHAGLDLLDEHCGVHSVDFRLWPMQKRTSAWRVEPSSIWVEPDHVTRVTRVIDHGGSCSVLAADAAVEGTAPHVVVTAGLWTPELCPWVETWGRWGWAFRGLPVTENVISIWAPYKQTVAFNMLDTMAWVGDGSALKLETAERPERAAASRVRCEQYVPRILRTIRGVRPYANLVRGDPCLVSRRGRVVAVTGGAKNGTIAAAWAARRVLEELR